MSQVRRIFLWPCFVAIAICLVAGCAGPGATEPVATAEGTPEQPDAMTAQANESNMADTEKTETAQTIPLDESKQPAAAPPDIAGIDKRISSYPRALWRSRTQSYEIYIGKVLNANYSTDKKELTVRTDRPDDNNLVCTYSGDGKLDIKAPEGSTATAKQCQSLLNRLNDLLNQ